MEYKELFYEAGTFVLSPCAIATPQDWLPLRSSTPPYGNPHRKLNLRLMFHSH